jgi:hypothetical protein
MIVMSHTTPQFRRLVLVPATTARSDELIRRYRLARLRVAGREAAAAAASPKPPRAATRGV